MGFEAPKGAGLDKYTYPGFNPEWLEDKELKERARKIAEFYRQQFKNIEIETSPEEEILIHFTTNIGLESIKRDSVIHNTSSFYDGGRENLSKQGFNLEQADEKFGNNKCTVAIPLKVFANWTDTLSWLKLTTANVLDNAIVLKVPKKDIMLRNGHYVENMFALDAKGADRSELDGDRLNYFNSTSFYNEDLFNDDQAMWEAWIPQEIALGENSIISYQEKE